MQEEDPKGKHSIKDFFAGLGPHAEKTNKVNQEIVHIRVDVMFQPSEQTASRGASRILNRILRSMYNSRAAGVTFFSDDCLGSLGICLFSVGHRFSTEARLWKGRSH